MFATAKHLFALAAIAGPVQKECAFQASSPKTSMAGLLIGLFFGFKPAYDAAAVAAPIL